MPNMPPTSSSRATNEPERPALANSRNGVIGCAARVSFEHERGKQHAGDRERGERDAGRPSRRTRP